MSVPVTPENVLARLMNDGIFDQLRARITQELKQNEELRSYTTSLVESSQALNSVGAERRRKRELFEALRKELERPVMDRASTAAWDIILMKEGIGKQIEEEVKKVFDDLSGCQVQADTAAVAPAAAVVPVVAPAAAVVPVVTPAAAEAPAVAPVAAVEPAVAPVAAVEPAVTPVAAVEPAVAPDAAVEPAVAPDAAVEPAAAVTLATAVESETKPVIEERTQPSSESTSTATEMDAQPQASDGGTAPAEASVSEKSSLPAAETASAAEAEDNESPVKESSEEDGTASPKPEESC